ncbi:hypothetical protein M9H77_08444 [Catharanthus roseus]|uniref:Uncharacterized protein n=1 Tax=Catharanthus roseus TaxID=4058 RepID=A0ACC0BXU4_CATRO|nr:hypothetical protein M9H77_08444 [Catharanthus roseus]
MKTSFRPGLKFVENQVSGRVSGLHCTWLVPCTRAFSDDVDGFLTLRVDPLEEGRRPRRVWPNPSTWTPHHALRLAREGQGSSEPLKGTQMPYSIAVDLVEGLGASGGIRASRFDTIFQTLDFRQAIRVNCLNFKMAHPSHRWTYREGTLVDEPSRTMSSSSSSYSLRDIVPEREPIPVIDLSDDESVEGPEMAPVASGIGLGTSIEEDPSEPASDSEMMPELEGVAPVDAEGTGTFTAVDRARDELESRPGCSGSQCPQAE